MKGKTVLLIYTFSMIVLSFISVVFAKSIDTSIAIMYSAAIATYGIPKLAEGVRKAVDGFKDRGGKE